MSGWIKIYRKITENPLYFSEPFSRLHAWLDLLIIANYSDSCIYIRGNKIEVKKGQIAKSQDALAERWMWSRGKVLRFLNDLENKGQIKQQKTRLITLIEISNFVQYQQGSTTESDGNGTTEFDEGGTTEFEADGTTEIKCKPLNINVKQKNIMMSDTTELTGNRSTEIEARSTTDSTTDGTTIYKEERKNIKETSLKRGKEKTGAAFAPPPCASYEPQASWLKKERLPAKEIRDMWNATCTTFPKLFTISENRKNKMRIRLEEMGGAEKAIPLLAIIFRKMQESNFLKGDNKRGWKASFDWLFENNKNWVKVWEGNYDNPKDAAPNAEKSDNINDIWK